MIIVYGCGGALVSGTIPLHCSTSHCPHSWCNGLGAIAYDSRSTLIVMRGTLTGQRYVDDILRPHREAFEKGIVDNLFQSKYFLSGILPFFNNMMFTVAEMLVRYGLNTPRSKGFMISVFGRILDDPDLLEYASHKAPGELKSSLMSDLRYYKQDTLKSCLGLNSIEVLPKARGHQTSARDPHVTLCTVGCGSSEFSM
ncbi:hypothetical protein TNCV_245351 [Trichonephila clavipes]|nr:hypothetical protein TNCV_245351 [Trichonephila clavipes]